MRKSILIAAIVTSLALGFWAGAVTGALLLQRAIFSHTASQHAWDTIERIEVLSRLRLGETNRAITILEMPLGDQVMFISDTYAPETLPRDGSDFRALLAAKAYLNIFPSTEPNARDVDEALRTVPILLDQENYTDGLNKLIRSFQPVPLAPSVGA